MKQHRRSVSEMKESGVKWIGELHKDWLISKLKQGAKNRTEKHDKADFHIDLENVESVTGRLIETESQEIEDTEETVQCIKFEATDVLFGKLRPYLRKYYLPDKYGTCSSEFLVIEAKKIDPRYLYSLIQIDAFIQYCVANSYGVKMPRTSWRYVREFEIPFPTIREQQLIGEFVQELNMQINHLVSTKINQIDLLREREKTLIHHAVTKGLDTKVKMKESGIEWIGEIPEGWEVLRLKYGVDIDAESLTENFDKKIMIKYIEITSVDSTGLISEPEEMLFGDAPTRARRIVHEGDTIISTVRPNLQAIAFFDKIPKNLIASTGFATLSPRSGFVPKFIYYYSFSHIFFNYAISRSVGVGYPAVGEKGLATIPLLKPREQEQFSIVSFLDSKTSKIHEAIKNIKSEISKLEEYRKSLIYEVVIGKVKVG